MQLITLGEFLAIAATVLGFDGEELAQLPGLEDANRALSAPFDRVGGIEVHPRLAQKAAVLCDGLLRSRTLPTQNELVVYITMIEFIRRGGAEWAPVAGEAERALMIEELASGALTQEVFATWLARQIA